MKMNSAATAVAAVVLVLSACGPQTAPQTTLPAARNAPATTIDQAEDLREQGKEEAFEESLRAIAAGPGSEADRAGAMLANYYFDEKRWAEAAPALGEAARENPSIAPFLQMRRVQALVELRQWDDAIATARSVITSAPGSSAAADATIWLPALHASAGNMAAADDTIGPVLAMNVNSFDEGAMVRAADVLAAAGRKDLARRIRWNVLTKNPTGAWTEKLWSLLRPAADKDSPVLALSSAEALALADRLASVNRLDQSLDLLDWLAKKDAALTSEASYRWTRFNALYRSRNYTDATTVEFKPSDAKYLEGRLQRGRAYWRSERPAEFVREMESLIAEFPKSKEAAEAKLLLASYYITDVQEPARSVKLLGEAIDQGAVGNEGENLWRLGWTHTIAGRDDEALAAFKRYIDRFPNNDWTMNALFWSAKIHERRGNTAARDAALRQIIERFPYNYYAYRAREILRAPAPSSQIASDVTFPDVTTIPPEIESRLATVRALLAAGMEEDAARELRIIARDRANDPATAWHMALLWSDAERPLEAMRLLQQSFPAVVARGAANVPDRFWQIIYPFPYSDIILREAKRQNLDPYMIASIIRQESAFNPHVVSNAGAAGLMQIMPAELDRITSRAGLPSATRDDLFIPEKNIAIGAAEFRQKLDAWDGDRALAMASYNAGETPVKRWVDRYGLTDRDFFIESIPYAETRLYVKILERNLNEYRRIYGDTGVFD